MGGGWSATTSASCWPLQILKSQLEVVRLLLEAGAARDCTEHEGNTGRMLASEKGHLEIARLMLHAGAPKNWANEFGRTARMLASESGHLEVARLLQRAGASSGDGRSNARVSSFARLLLHAVL